MLSWAVVPLGMWEVLAPFILGYFTTSVVLWNAITTGIVVVVLAALAAISKTEATVKALEWTNAVLGMWLVVAPFIIHYSAIVAAKWNDIIVGVGVIVLAVWAALTMTAGSSAGP